MAGSFNMITLVGYLGRDPESRTTQAGHQVATFTLATDDRRKDQDERQTTWFRISCFGRLAEISQEYLKKGSYIYLQGSISQETYTDRDGQSRTSLEVRARDLQMLDRRNDNGHEGSGGGGQRGARNGPANGGEVPF